MSSVPERARYGDDVAFLKKHIDVVELKDGHGGCIAIVPAWQGRTMTSSALGSEGISYGWLNYELIGSGRHDPQVNLYGGEDRYWISPEGSQGSFFFNPGAPMTFAQWRTPAALDTEAFRVIAQGDRFIELTHRSTLINYLGNSFEMQFDRRVAILTREEATRHLQMDLPADVQIVGHESHNRLTNVGSSAWTHQTGLPGIWMLCMNKPSPEATIVIPFQTGSEQKLGPVLTSNYFGELDEQRLKIDLERGLIFFLGDGQFRSKIGLSFARSRPTMGSWDDEAGTLTVVQFNLPANAPQGYTSNLWQVLDDPFSGDCINSYNDGPNESGGMLGPFYELETLSPALNLGPDEAYTHIHRTFHFEGTRESLSALCERLLGVDVATICSQFSQSRPGNSSR